MQIEGIRGGNVRYHWNTEEKKSRKKNAPHNITSSLSWVKFCLCYMYSTAYFGKRQNNEQLFAKQLYIIHVWKTQLYHHWHFVIVLGLSHSLSPSHTHTHTHTHTHWHGHIHTHTHTHWRGHKTTHTHTHTLVSKNESKDSLTRCRGIFHRTPDRTGF